MFRGRLWVCSERPGQIIVVQLLPWLSLFQWSCPPDLSHSCGLNICTVFLFPALGISSCDIHPLSLQFIPSTTPTPAYPWTPAGSEIHWSYFSWLFIFFMLSLPPQQVIIAIFLLVTRHSSSLTLSYPLLVLLMYLPALRVCPLCSQLCLQTSTQPSQLLFPDPRPQVGILQCLAVQAYILVPLLSPSSFSAKCLASYFSEKVENFHRFPPALLPAH